MTRDPHYEDGPRLIGGSELPRPVDTRETRPICGERPTGCMGFVAMQRACVLDRHHEGDHKAKDGTTFSNRRKSYRTVVQGSYVENVRRR